MHQHLPAAETTSASGVREPGQPNEKLKRHAGEAEATRINRKFSTEPSKVCPQWPGNNTRIDPARARLNGTGKTSERRRHYITPMHSG